MKNRLLAALILLFVSSGAMAEAWPNRVIRVVVPTAAGSSVDIVARVVGEKLGPMLGQTRSRFFTGQEVAR